MRKPRQRRAIERVVDVEDVCVTGLKGAVQTPQVRIGDLWLPSYNPSRAPDFSRQQHRWQLSHGKYCNQLDASSDGLLFAKI